jgi:hypothetical protein
MLRILPTLRETRQRHVASNNREVMVSTVGVKQSLPSSTFTFPFLCPATKYYELLIMQDWVWREAARAIFLLELPPNKRGK